MNRAIPSAQSADVILALDPKRTYIAGYTDIMSDSTDGGDVPNALQSGSVFVIHATAPDLSQTGLRNFSCFVALDRSSLL
jgi:hypothetical protein